MASPLPGGGTDGWAACWQAGPAGWRDLLDLLELLGEEEEEEEVELHTGGLEHNHTQTD